MLLKKFGPKAHCAPRQALQHRSDTKMYRLQSPQTPLVRTQRYGEYHMDEFPSGTNMIVAVLAYTGAHHLPPALNKYRCRSAW